MKLFFKILVTVLVIAGVAYFVLTQSQLPSTEGGNDGAIDGTQQSQQTSRTTRPSNAQEATVAFVHDGDTLYLQPPGTTSRSDEITVRLIGLDTPEIRPTVECYGIEARDYLRQLLPQGSQVWYAYDLDHKDPYDRTLLYVWTSSGKFVNLELVQNGYATALKIAPNDEYWPELSAAESNARTNSLGMWGNC